VSASGGNGATEPFIPIPRAMKESPAWRSLTLHAHRVLDRLEVEWSLNWTLQYTNTNGRLIVTHRDFIAAGVRKHDVKKALDEANEKGLIEVMERGRWNEGSNRRASRYRLTYLPMADAPPTNEWQWWVPPPKAPNRKRPRKPPDAAKPHA
jgi:hypothetical protein